MHVKKLFENNTIQNHLRKKIKDEPKTPSQFLMGSLTKAHHDHGPIFRFR